ncbi:hypothetical protein J6590_066602 [Homalodisca vitripennis]|nr:hypothetical protein J6590_066602 [Homalodisca vitripennis]
MIKGKVKLRRQVGRPYSAASSADELKMTNKLETYVSSKEGETSSDPDSPVKAGRRWHALMLRQARDFDTYGTNPNNSNRYLPQFLNLKKGGLCVCVGLTYAKLLIFHYHSRLFQTSALEDRIPYGK